MGKLRLYAIVFGVALLFAVPEISATVLHVPADYPTIQTAIDSALVGDTVLVADGIYRGEGNRDIVFHGRDVTVKSCCGPDACIIDCEGSMSDRHSAFYIGYSDRDAEIVLTGFTITNGYATTGGAIRIVQSSPKIENCVFYNNYAVFMGGAINIRDANIDTLANCLFINNAATEAGAIFISMCSPLIYQCSFINNVGMAQIAQISTEDYAFPAIHYSLFVGSTVFSQPECCDWGPVVGPSDNHPLNCIHLNHGYLTDLWDVDSTTSF